MCTDLLNCIATLLTFAEFYTEQFTFALFGTEDSCNVLRLVLHCCTLNSLVLHSTVDLEAEAHLFSLFILRKCTARTELRFVATVTTSSRVKFVPAVYIFPENNAIYHIISVDKMPIRSLINSLKHFHKLRWFTSHS